MVITKATVQQALDMSKVLWARGVSPEESLKLLKDKKYVSNNVKYQASHVAQGIAMILSIHGAIINGKLKATQKGLQLGAK